jgi:GT2 family glycosyltransferase
VPARLSAVIVTHRHADVIARTLEALVAQLRPDDELIVVDNDSPDGTAGAVRESAPRARVIESGANLGFPAACNLGAARATGELLVFLNPDAAPAPGWREAIAAPLDEGWGWGAWQALVTCEGGARINTRGGVVHFTGIAWAGGAGEPAPPQEAGEGDARRAGTGAGDPSAEPGFVSGACLAIPRALFRELGGFAEAFFLYHEDVDLSLRVRLAGERLGVVPQARVEHDYEFEKGPAKWRYLERNRWATLLRCYPGALLALLAPALLATELALVPISLAGGWWRQKLAAWVDTARSLPRLLRERRAIQSRRGAGAREFARALTPDLDSPYLGAAARSAALRFALRAYWRAVLTALRT